MTGASILTAKEKTLVGIGAAIASGCKSCTASYVQAARTAGACERSIRLAIETALAERQAATDAMAEWAREVQGVVPVVDDSFRTDKQKNTALIASVAAHVVNSTATLDANVARAQEQGWSVAQIAQGLAVGRGAARVAAEKADDMTREAGIGRVDAGGSCCEESSQRPAAAGSAQSGCGCGCA